MDKQALVDKIVQTPVFKELEKCPLELDFKLENKEKTMKKLIAFMIILLLCQPLGFAGWSSQQNSGQLLKSGTTSWTPQAGDTSGNAYVRSGAFCYFSSSTPTITNGAYHANDVVGGVQSLTGVSRVSGGSAIISGMTIVDRSNVKASFDVFFFNANPTGSTTTDNGALTIASADLSKYIGHISVLTTDYVSDSATGFMKVVNKNLPIKLATGTTLYAVMVTRGTPTYTSTSALTLTVNVYQD